MLLRRNAEPSGRWRPSDGKGKVVGLYICTMRRYAPSQYRQVLLRAPTSALCYISNPTTASTFALACCDEFCQRRAKLYLTYCKRAFGKPQSGKSARTTSTRKCLLFPSLGRLYWQFLGRTHATNFLTSAPISQGTFPGDASTTLSTTCFDVAQSVLSLLIVGARHVPSAPLPPN